MTGIIYDLPETAPQIPVQVGIAGTDRRTDRVDGAEVLLEKWTGELLGHVFPGFLIRGEIALAEILKRETQVLRNSLRLSTAEERMLGLTTVGAGPTINTAPHLRAVS